MSSENKELFIEYEKEYCNSYLLMSSNKLYYIPTVHCKDKYTIFDMFIFNEIDLCFKYQLVGEDGYILKFIKFVEEDDKYLVTNKWIVNHVVVNEYTFFDDIKEINYDLVKKYNKV